VTARLGFLGVGWIGRDRMQAIAASGAATVAAVADVDLAAAEAAAADVGCDTVLGPDELLGGAVDLDGMVIATPSALHAEHAMLALGQGLAVFCQKPLGRNAAECSAIIEAAQRADRLLGVDLSYRHLTAVDAIRDALARQAIGSVHAVELVFHNAYGPDKKWFTDPELSGGGCVIDLGIHLVDLALWLLDWPEVGDVHSRLFAEGRLLRRDPDVVEDHAIAHIDLAGGRVMDVACSWFLHAGRDAVISVTLHGTEGALVLENVDGSFYDFRAALHRGTSSEVLVEPPDEWGGRAAVAWAQRVSAGEGFDEAALEHVTVSAVLDRVYGR
jgi:predicted dehydrogenase